MTWYMLLGSSSKNRVVHLPAFKVKAVDTTGAGDAFSAGLAVALSEGMDIVDAVRFANAIAASSINQDVCSRRIT